MSDFKVNRPLTAEDENDLLKLQEKFMQAAENLSVAHVERLSNSAGVDKSPSTICENYLPQDDPPSEKSEPMDVETGLGSSGDNGSSPIVLGIVERDTSATVAHAPKLVRGQSFPTVRRLRTNFPGGTFGDKGLSLFAQQMKSSLKRKEVPRTSSRFGKKVVQLSSSGAKSKSSGLGKGLEALGDTSVVVDGAGLGGDQAKASLAKEIHDDNLSKLRQMSEEEILKEKKHLLETLDQNLIEFLKKKRSAAQMSTDSKSPGANQETEYDEIENLELTAPSFPNSKSETLPLDDAECINIVENEELQPAKPTSRSDKCYTVESMDSEEGGSGCNFPIPPTDTNKWLHMGKVERDKLEWTTNLPKPSLELAKTGLPARFDFEGMLISVDTDVPTHVGLHHHGENPEVPGYTLEELFVYGRSSILQQRVLALSTIANILAINHRGRFDECLVAPLLPQLLDAGLVLLLRWALDDNAENNVAATISALHSLVVNPEEEACLDYSFPWYRGEEFPFVQPELDSPLKSGFPQESSGKEEELQDAELVKLDVIKGLVRMDLLPRLRYILEVGLPDVLVTVQILEIIIRISRHSTELCLEVVRCPRLLKTVVAQYLPASWNLQGQINTANNRLTSAKGVPLRQAVKLIRVLASAGFHVATELLTRHDIAASLLCYASIDPQETGVPLTEALDLCLESYDAWRIFLHYGLATEAYEDFYPLLMRQLQHYQNLCCNMDVGKRSYDFRHASHLLGLLATAVRATNKQGDTNSEAAPIKLEWRHVQQLAPHVQLCLKKWMWELALADEITYSTLSLMGSTLEFVNDFYESLTSQVDLGPTKPLEARQQLLVSTFIPFMESETFRRLLSLLPTHSSFLCQHSEASKRYSKNLPFIGAVLWDGNLTPCLKEGSPFSLLTQLVRCLFTFHSAHGSPESNACALLVDHPLTIQYLNQLIRKSTVPISCWFNKFEAHFLAHLCLLASLKIGKNINIYHRVCLFLLPNLQQGDENLVMSLLKSVVFNPSFITELGDLSTDMENLGFKEKVALSRPTLRNAPSFKLVLLQQTGSSLSSIFETFRSSLAANFANFGAGNRRRPRCSLAIQHFLVPPLSADFVYLPIAQVYRKVTVSAVSTSAEDGVSLLHSLQWCHLLECWRTSAAQVVPSQVRFCYLCLVFLASADMFLDPEIGGYLEGCLRRMSEIGALTTPLLESATIPQIASFHDLYTQLLEQYEAVSYGDSLFGNIILVPLQQKYSLQLRRAIWTENITVARALRVKLSDLILPLESFLQPVETDLDLLACYFRAILNGDVHPVRNQFLYVLAIHHLHHSLFVPSSVDGAKQLRDRICEQLTQKDSKELLYHLQCYSQPNISSAVGFSCSE